MKESEVEKDGDDGFEILEEKLDELEEMKKTLDNLSNDLSLRGKEPIAFDSLIPLMGTLIDSIVETINAVLDVVSDAEDVGGKPTAYTMVFPVHFVSRALHALWEQKDNKEFQTIGFHLEKVIATQNVVIPLAIYDAVKDAINQNLDNPKFRELLVAMFSEQSGESPEKVMQELKKRLAATTSTEEELQEKI